MKLSNIDDKVTAQKLKAGNPYKYVHEDLKIKTLKKMFGVFYFSA